jgi:DNA polymerase III delta subunit
LALRRGQRTRPVYLLYGSDRPTVVRAVRRLRERLGNDSTERLNARESSGADAVAACNSLGLFAGEGRLVIVDEAERWKAPDVKEIVAYLAAPAPATVLALVAEEIKSDAALVKAVAKAGQPALRRYETKASRLGRGAVQRAGQGPCRRVPCAHRHGRR